MRYLGAKDTFFFIVCYRGFCTAQQNKNAMEIDTGIFFVVVGKVMPMVYGCCIQLAANFML